MTIARVLIAEFKHETNTFCSEKTGKEKFNNRYLKFGEEIINFFEGTKVETGGIIDGCKEENIEIIPTIAANAMPGGPVTREMFELVKTNILDAINKEKHIDGILLSMHGAMVLEDAPDGEGELLEAIRDAVGKDTPIMASLDLHANITEKMTLNVNGLFPFDKYPHIDMYERGYEAAKNLARMLRKEIKPVIRIKKLPLLSPCLETDKDPYKPFLDMVHRWEKDTRVISASVVAGFPYADIYDAGVTVMAQTNDDVLLAEQIVEQVGNAIMVKHQKFIKEALPIEEAIRRGMEAPAGPVVLADVADNPGGGSPGDTTYILRKLLEMKAKNVGFAIITDPEVVERAIKAGVGSSVNVKLGGKMNPLSGKPIEVTAVVKTIADGKFVNKGPMGRGLKNNLGRTVVLDKDSIEVIVTERRLQPWDPEIFRRLGIEPKDKQILVVKSSLHYRAAFSQLAKEIIDVDAPGLVPPNIKHLDLKKVHRPIFPLDALSKE